MKCPYCDNEVPNGVTSCPSCGAAVANTAPATPDAQQPPYQQQPGQISGNGKSASTATLLSCLITGLGQMYLGQVGKGVVMLIGSVILSVCTGGFSGLVTWIIGMVDANKIGKKIEAGHSVGPWEFF